MLLQLLGLVVFFFKNFDQVHQPEGKKKVDDFMKDETAKYLVSLC